MPPTRKELLDVLDVLASLPFLHSSRYSLRFLPCSPLASARLEHSAALSALAVASGLSGVAASSAKAALETDMPRASAETKAKIFMVMFLSRLDTFPGAASTPSVEATRPGAPYSSVEAVCTRREKDVSSRCRKCPTGENHHRRIRESRRLFLSVVMLRFPAGLPLRPAAREACRACGRLASRLCWALLRGRDGRRPRVVESASATRQSIKAGESRAPARPIFLLNIIK